MGAVIVSGSIHVSQDDRDGYLEECREVIVVARQTDGCMDFHLSADPIEPGRINVYEKWRSVADVEAFRGSGPSTEQTAAIIRASVVQHEVASSRPL